MIQPRTQALLIYDYQTKTKFTFVANYVQIYFALYMINKQKHCLILLYCRFSILSERVEGLPPISKHREELKIQGEAEYF